MVTCTYAPENDVSHCQWCLSLEFKDELVSVPVIGPGIGLQPQSGSAESEAGGTLEGYCHGGGTRGYMVMIMGYKLSWNCPICTIVSPLI